MTAQHTPGPWSLCGPDTDLVRDENYRAVARASFRATPTANLIHETKANARLIAAAPDLLNACRKAALVLAALSETCPPLIQEYEIVSAAIAKAGGAA